MIAYFVWEICPRHTSFRENLPKCHAKRISVRCHRKSLPLKYFRGTPSYRNLCLRFWIISVCFEFYFFFTKSSLKNQIKKSWRENIFFFCNLHSSCFAIPKSLNLTFISPVKRKFLAAISRCIMLFVSRLNTATLAP